MQQNSFQVDIIEFMSRMALKKDASKTVALAVSRKGATASPPFRDEWRICHRGNREDVMIDTRLSVHSKIEL